MSEGSEGGVNEADGQMNVSSKALYRREESGTHCQAGDSCPHPPPPYPFKRARAGGGETQSRKSEGSE